jgi:hypothetical protein
MQVPHRQQQSAARTQPDSGLAAGGKTADSLFPKSSPFYFTRAPTVGQTNVDRTKGPPRKSSWPRATGRTLATKGGFQRYPKARPFVHIIVSDIHASLSYTWDVGKFRHALGRDGAYLLGSNQAGWSAQEFWETYIQLTVVERAFRVLKSELLLRPIWQHDDKRTQAHIFVCVLAYALWKTLDHLAKHAGPKTLIRKPDPEHGDASPKPRPMTPQAILRELSQIHIGDILLETTAGQKLALRRVARPNSEQKRILDALQLEIPERLSSDRLL